MSFRSLWSMRNYIHINLCISLIVAQVANVALHTACCAHVV